MALSCGIVGLPNVGKSTLFNALTSAKVAAANFPFCTIDPNVGVVVVPDARLKKITALIKPKKEIPTAFQFVDIAGLVRGASKGEGLGNQFLGHIKQVDAVAHIVRCFEDPNVVHVDGAVNPQRDIDTIQTELCLADFETADKASDRAQKAAKHGDAVLVAKALAYKLVRDGLATGKPVRLLPLTPEQKLDIADLHLLTAKPVLYVCNVSESDLGKPNLPHVETVRALAKAEGASVVEISAQVESEIAELSPEERTSFLADLGLKESGLDRMVRAGYELLNLITYFTAGEQEVRAWTILRGTKAPQAAGVIHTDFERGFICAEIYHCDDLFSHGSEATVRTKGLVRLEGKEYTMRDGDVVHFRFNV